MKLIHEIADELHQIVTNINHAFIDGELDHLPGPLEQKEILINHVLINTGFSAKVCKKEGDNVLVLWQ